MNPEGQYLVIVKGVGELVCLAIYDNLGPDGAGQLRGGVRVTPEQARILAGKLTWESMAVEEGNR